MNDEEIDELTLSRPQQRRDQETSDRTLSAANLTTLFNKPESRIQDRLRTLAEQDRVKASTAAPNQLDDYPSERPIG
jgi:hypothetical protein